MSDKCDFPWHPTDPSWEVREEEAGEGNSSVLFSCQYVAKYSTYFIKELIVAFLFHDEVVEA